MSGKVRRTKGLTPTEVKIGGTDREGVPRFLVYGLPRGEEEHRATIEELDDIDLHVVPRGSSDSFLDFDGVVVFAGSFEQLPQHAPGFGGELRVKCDSSDLQRRERQLHTLIQSGRPFIFLVPPILDFLDSRRLSDGSDMFRRFMRTLPIDWHLRSASHSCLEARITEFRSFIEQYGAGSVEFYPPYDYLHNVAIIVGDKEQIYGFELQHLMFLLPCHPPNSQQEAVDMAAEAVRAVIAYRERMSEEMPAWTAEFEFTKETALRETVDREREAIARLETELDKYTKRKGALCYRSEPLVRVVNSLLELVFGLPIKSEEQCVEDVRVLDDDGNIVAIVEIKGVNKNFKREDVNQVDNHRERLKLADDTPGLLIMNTKMDAKSLDDKDEAPHPDIIKKAVQDNVLLVRTLDLLRYADLVESERIAKELFRSTILSESGWLRVEDGAATVLKE